MARWEARVNLVDSARTDCPIMLRYDGTRTEPGRWNVINKGNWLKVQAGWAKGFTPNGSLYLCESEDSGWGIELEKFWRGISFFIEDGKGDWGDGTITAGWGVDLKSGPIGWANTTGWH